MKTFTILISVAALITIGAARYLPKAEHVKQTPDDWKEHATKIGLDDEQKTAVVELMQFIRDQDLSSAEMDTNTEWKHNMEEKCKHFIGHDQIDPMNEKVGDKKWEDMKDTDCHTKWAFWHEKYTTWDDEEDKMKALKNMCYLIVEHAAEPKIMDVVKEAGLAEDDWKPMTHMIWKVRQTKTPEEKLIEIADHCHTLKTDHTFLEIDEKILPKSEWENVKDKDMKTKMEFWWNAHCKTDDKVSKIKMMKNMCILYNCPDERKKLEEWGKKAGFPEIGQKKAAELIMKLRFAKDDQKFKVLHMTCKDWGKGKEILLPTLEADDLTKWNEVKEKDTKEKMQFWRDQYLKLTEGDKMKAMRNICVLSADTH